MVRGKRSNNESSRSLLYMSNPLHFPVSVTQPNVRSYSSVFSYIISLLTPSILSRVQYYVRTGDISSLPSLLLTRPFQFPQSHQNSLKTVSDTHQGLGFSVPSPQTQRVFTSTESQGRRELVTDPRRVPFVPESVESRPKSYVVTQGTS